VRVGQLFAERFDVEAVVGSGAMGVVLAARDRVGGGRVALKVLGERTGERERFLQEGRMLAELRHPGVVGYVAHGLTPSGELYLAMEWLEGQTLAERLAPGPLTVEETLALGRRTAGALAHAHAAGIIHRDLKPSNIFLPGGDPAAAKLLDFGVARFARGARRTMTGAVVGTPDYMSPEQAAGKAELDARADLYALGCVLFECIAGRPPFRASSAVALFAEIAFEEAPRLAEHAPGTPAFLDELVARLLAKRPDDRPASADDVARALAGRDGAAAVTRAHLGREEQRLAGIVLVGPGGARPALSGASDDALSASEDAKTAPQGARGPVDGDDAPGADDLEAAASSFGGRGSRLVDGSFVATVTGFGSATDLAAQVARLALALRAARPASRVAAALGRSVLGGRQPMGEAIARAGALLERPAPAAGARLDEVTAGLLDARFLVAGDDDGLAVTGERDLAPTARRLLGKEVPCVGRERELATLEGLLDECVEEPLAQAVLVTGPPGVGKSRLRFELLRRARERGAQIWLARGDPMRAGSPYGLAADLVRVAAGVKDDDPPALARRRVRARAGRHLPETDARRVATFLAELIGVGAGERGDAVLAAARQNPTIMGDQIQRAWDDLLAAEVRAAPLVIALEDLHWGDLPSVRLVDSALRALEERPLLVLAIARPDVGALFPRLWADRRTHTLRIDELRRRAAEALVKAALGDDVPRGTVERLVSLSGGNVFHLEELIRAVAEGETALPGTVLAMAHARLESLEPEARRLLRAASVLGEAFWPGGVRALVGDGVDVDAWLEDLTRREVVTRRAQSRFAREPEYTFRHALVREAADAALTPEDRRLGHRLAAAWLERAGERDAMVLGEHWERAGDARAAVRFYLAAAEQALRGNDLAAALARAGRGITCGAEGETLGALHLLAAEAHRWRGDFAAAVADGDAALALLAVGDPRWYVAAGELATCAGLLGREDRLVALAAALRASATSASAPLVVAGARAAVQLFHAGRFAMGAELVDWLEGLVAGEPEDPSVTGWLGRARSIQGSKVGDWDTVLAACARSADALAAAGDARNAVLQKMNLGDAQANLGLYEEAERSLRQVLAEAERLGLSHVVAPTRSMLAKALAGQGALDAAVKMGGEAEAQFRAQGDRRMQALTSSDVALWLAAGGRLAEAHALAEEAAAVAPSGSVRGACLAVVADVHLAAGRAADARRVAAEAMALLEAHGGIDEREAFLRWIWARALDAAGEAEAADRALADARARLEAAAAKIRDPAVREAALTRVRENRGVLDGLPGRSTPPAS
jgi:tetratricopeptide (TPR) repeat protein